MSQFVDPSFELGTADWTYGGNGLSQATRTDLLGARTGTFAVSMSPRFTTVLGVPTQNPSWIEQDIDCTPGVAVPLFCYVDVTSATGDVAIRALVDGSLVASQTIEAVTGGYTLIDFGVFVPTASTHTVRFEARIVNLGNTADLMLDDASSDAEGSDLAILLASRAVYRILATLQANLSAEITAAAADWNTMTSESITVPAPGAYYGRPKGELTNVGLALEVFEGSFDSTNPYTDLASDRAVYDVPVTVRATLWNTDAVDADDIGTRIRLVGAAIYRTLNTNYTLGGTDDAIKSCVPTGYQPAWEFGVDNRVTKVRVAIPCVVKCEEVSS